MKEMLLVQQILTIYNNNNNNRLIMSGIIFILDDMLAPFDILNFFMYGACKHKLLLRRAFTSHLHGTTVFCMFAIMAHLLYWFTLYLCKQVME